VPKLILPSGDCTRELRDWLAVFGTADNVVIEGQGAGLSFSNQPINLTGMRPKVSGLTVEAEGRCISFENPAESILNDVWTYSKAGGTGIWCGITAAAPANESAPGGKFYQPKRGQEDTLRVKRAYACAFRDCFAFGDGDGWFLGADFDWYAIRLQTGQYPGFANHFLIEGGATYVKGMGMRWNYLNNSTFNHHVDAWPEKGLYISENSKFNKWHGGWVEPNYKARQDKTPVVLGPGAMAHGSPFTYTPPIKLVSWDAVTSGQY